MILKTKWQLLFALLVTTGICCNSEKKILKRHLSLGNVENTNSVISRIDFQKGFMNDTVSLRINNQLILNKIVLKSDDLVEFTNLSIYFFVNKNNTYFASYFGKNIEGKDFDKKEKLSTKIEKEIILNIIINKTVNTITVDLSRGKFVGISKK